MLWRSIDNSNFKNYVFSLLFLKRTDGVFEEEVETLIFLESYGHKEAEDATYFRMPVQAR